MKTCPSCKTENSDLATFCRKCGARIGSDEAPFKPGNGTVVDANLANGGSPGQQVGTPKMSSHQSASPEPGGNRPRFKDDRTKIDDRIPPAQRESPQPDTSPKRKLVGFLISFSLNPDGAFFPLYQGRIKIGAYVESDLNIVIPRDKDSLISEEHSLVLWRGHKLAIKDLESSNGTYVDVETASRQDYPELYEAGSANLIKDDEFDEKPVKFISIEDEKVTLVDGSYIRIGKTVFKVKLVH